MDTRIIIVDDDPDYLEILAGKLTAAGFPIPDLEEIPQKALARFDAGETWDVALIDMTMPEMDGLELLENIRAVSPNTECIMVTAVNEARVAVECLKKGAYDYLVKPVAAEDLLFSLKRTLERKRLLEILHLEKGDSRPELENADAFRPIITGANRMLRILREAELHAVSEVPILITGESGTGKELLARAIHAASKRADRPFTPVNMAAVAAGVFESEFFGHERGAFTGAERRRSGLIEHSEGGTLFMDEIGNVPLELQGKLLRVLQDGEYLRIGTSKSKQADIRFIAATNENLEQLMISGRFRKDLYYRIRGGWLHLPPLKQRREDIPLLAAKFLTEWRGPEGCLHIEDSAMCMLEAYDYPGNVRELQSIIQSAANLAQQGPITETCLPDILKKGSQATLCGETVAEETNRTLAAVEKAHIVNVYHQTGRNKSKTARTLAIGLNTLRRKLKTYGMK